MSQILNAAVQPKDNASATFFRIAFGWLMAAWAWNYLASGRVTELYVTPDFNFTYCGFDWVTPWPGNGMYFHFLAMVVLALCIAAGWQYRLVSACFAVCFTYVFLLERTNYQNHYYLIGLFSWWLPFLPLHRNVALDARRRPATASQVVPAWVLWVLQFHVGIPYIYGGLAKLTPDWLLGQPMGIFLATKADFPVLGDWLAWPATAMLFSWFGLLFDLGVVPALLWKRTRVPAYLLCIAFHLANSVLFRIHVFPWFMIVATTLFFDPDWPRQLLAGSPVAQANKPTWQWTSRRRLLVPVAVTYVLFQCLWPLRSHWYGGETSWSERGHLFSWRMMLRAKEVGLGYAVWDPATEQVANVDHKQFIAPEQAEKFARDPELILSMAHFIADKFEAEIGRRPQVHAFVLTSLNGRKPQLMVDPNTDLAAQPRRFRGKRDWVVPLEEPLRQDPWKVPIDQWRQYIELPEITFLQEMKREAAAPLATR